MNNPVRYVDPDGGDVLPSDVLKANKSVYSLFLMATKNKVFYSVMGSFYRNENHVYIHLAQLKDKHGNPTGFRNIARTEPWNYSKNPVAKYNIHRIVINSDLLSSDGVLRVDKTFVFRALLHEGIHARMLERLRQTGFEGYPGHKDFKERGGEWHHNQMGAFNRQELIEGMKEFDNQLRAAGEEVPDYHTEEWYHADSCYSILQRLLHTT
jgi:hypothetical protein